MNDISSPARTIDAPVRPARHAYGRLTGALVLVAVLVLGGWFAWMRVHRPPPGAGAAPLAEVTVSRPLVHDLDRQLGFLGQFSAVDRVELRAQVGGELTEIDFKDGDLVHRGDLLFVIDPRPYDIQLAAATAQLKTAVARLALAEQQLYRAQELRRTDFGTVETVDQRTAEVRSSEAAIDAARSRIRDADFDMEHCRIVAPFTGRIGSHLVSVGNLVAGSRAATSPTTLLTTLVSQDPIYLDFDMSEGDFLAFSGYRSGDKKPLAQKVSIALDDGKGYRRQGVLDFIDNALNRSSGTIPCACDGAEPGFRAVAGRVRAHPPGGGGAGADAAGAG